jgi:hypothetical protein
MRKKAGAAVVFNMADTFPLYSFEPAISNLNLAHSVVQMLMIISIKTGKPDRVIVTG